jgi:hypothetical protein
VDEAGVGVGKTETGFCLPEKNKTNRIKRRKRKLPVPRMKTFCNFILNYFLLQYFG